MSFLPIVERELRESARRRATYRIRWWTAVVALIVCFIALLGAMARGLGSPGETVFSVLTGYAFGLALLAGIFLTADCLSQEKREGTLGLLFLTDLKGYDVVLGKFASRSLGAFFMLFSLLPITAIPLLMGGVTGGEFWRMALALVNALFVSLALGMSVSAFMRDSQRAIGRAFALLLALVVLLPIVQSLSPKLPYPWLWRCAAWISPFYPYSYASDLLYFRHAGMYWGALAVSQLFGWLLLGLASFALPYCWQEAAPQSRRSPKRLLRWRRGASFARAKLRQKLLLVNPVLALIAGEPSFEHLAWIIVAIWGVVALGALAVMGQGTQAFIVSPVAKPLGFLLKMLVALQACRFFAEARRNGALEMLLCTPLSSQEIIRGQWLALKRQFQWPVVVFSGIELCTALVPILFCRREGFDFPSLLSGSYAMVSAGLYCVGMVADVYAAGWFGMWLALSLKKPEFAQVLTLLYVLILPSLFCGLGSLADIFFIAWGVSRLSEDLRRTPSYPHLRSGMAAGTVPS
jgi:ABC-type transport system involved in multi-copper enzyme maturation permease subunit